MSPGNLEQYNSDATTASFENFSFQSSWSEHGAYNARVVGLISIWTIHLRADSMITLSPFQLRTFHVILWKLAAASTFSIPWTLVTKATGFLGNLKPSLCL